MPHLDREELTFDQQTGKVGYNARLDYRDLVLDNEARQKDPANGFTANRTMRQIGSIPLEVLLDYSRKFMREHGIGIHQLEKADEQAILVAFLNDNPQYRTVERMKTTNANDGHIIVR